MRIQRNSEYGDDSCSFTIVNSYLRCLNPVAISVQLFQHRTNRLATENRTRCHQKRLPWSQCQRIWRHSASSGCEDGDEEFAGRYKLHATVAGERGHGCRASSLLRPSQHETDEGDPAAESTAPSRSCSAARLLRSQRRNRIHFAAGPRSAGRLRVWDAFLRGGDERLVIIPKTGHCHAAGRLSRLLAPVSARLSEGLRLQRDALSAVGQRSADRDDWLGRRHQRTTVLPQLAPHWRLGRHVDQLPVRTSGRLLELVTDREIQLVFVCVLVTGQFYEFMIYVMVLQLAMM